MNETLQINGEKFLSRKGVMELFGVSNVTLWKWTKKGVIHPHQFGRTTYFLESEILEDMKKTGGRTRQPKTVR